MKLCNKLLFVAAISMAGLQGVSAQSVPPSQPWAGERPLFSDFDQPRAGSGVSRAQVQNEARDAIANDRFSEGRAHLAGLERSTNSQSSAVSRSAVRAESPEDLIRVGDGY